jgi:hypothetical protein
VAAPAISGARRETEEEPDFGGAAADLDVEELARRVYAEVKRRLAIEWERLRPQT